MKKYSILYILLLTQVLFASENNRQKNITMFGCCLRLDDNQRAIDSVDFVQDLQSWMSWGLNRAACCVTYPVILCGMVAERLHNQERQDLGRLRQDPIKKMK